VADMSGSAGAVATNRRTCRAGPSRSFSGASPLDRRSRAVLSDKSKGTRACRKARRPGDAL